MKKSVVYCLSRNYYDKMIPSLKSMLAHTNIDTVYVVAEDDELPFEVPDIVKVINVTDQKYFDPKRCVNYNSPWTYMVLMRCAYAHLLPDEDQVLSIDADTIIHEDISPLWNYDLTGYYLAGAREVELSARHCSVYINFGVAMLNLKEMRKLLPSGRNMADEMIWWVNNVKLMYIEQDVHNKLCAGKILEIPSDYNATKHPIMTMDTDHVVIRHYAGEGEWYDYPEVQEWVGKPWPGKKSTKV